MPTHLVYIDTVEHTAQPCLAEESVSYKCTVTSGRHYNIKNQMLVLTDGPDTKRLN